MPKASPSLPFLLLQTVFHFVVVVVGTWAVGRTWAVHTWAVHTWVAVRRAGNLVGHIPVVRTVVVRIPVVVEDILGCFWRIRAHLVFDRLVVVKIYWHHKAGEALSHPFLQKGQRSLKLPSKGGGRRVYLLDGPKREFCCWSSRLHRTISHISDPIVRSTLFHKSELTPQTLFVGSTYRPASLLWSDEAPCKLHLCSKEENQTL